MKLHTVYIHPKFNPIFSRVADCWEGTRGVATRLGAVREVILHDTPLCRLAASRRCIVN